MNTDFLIDRIRSVYKDMGYAFFEKGNFNLNTGGIRCDNTQSDLWDDIRFHIYKDKGQWQVRTWTQTTDPGKPGLLNPCRPEGCAILVPDQYRSVYKGGYHKGDSNRWSLIQCEDVSVYRDKNKDACLDFDPSTIMRGKFGINIHDPYKDNLEKVGDGSLACQVAESKKGHREFMDIYNISVAKWGERITYTLLLESYFK